MKLHYVVFIASLTAVQALLDGKVPGTGGCNNHSDCSDNRACNVDHQCVDPCRGYCSILMDCIVTGHRPQCRCPQGLQGDPTTGCNQPPTVVPTCTVNNDCPSHLACVQSKCLDPCEGACGANERCELRDHKPHCSCRCNPSGCSPEPECLTSEECDGNQACINGVCTDPCVGAGCGPNTECHVSQHTASCIPTPVRPPPVDCTLECSGDDQCPAGRACMDHHCVDPCSDRCGVNSTCRVMLHVPSCQCLPSHTGNAFKGCRHQPGTNCLKRISLGASGVKKFKTHTTNKVDWLEALLKCRKNGHRLATVMNQQELVDIKEAISDTYIRGGNFWIAGTDKLHKKEWFWFTIDEMQRIGEFRDWMKGQPDLDSEDCLEFWERNRQEGYKWNNRPCHQKHHFICEYFE